MRTRAGSAPSLDPVADAPIGIFDSGYGGLTVARAVLDQLPHESIAYFGDTARAPYGPRPIAESREFALECLDRLVDHGVKALVIACNTASAAVLHDARERYDVPVVEVIRPAVRRAARATRNHRVGVISTQGTHQSGAYVDAFAAAPHLEVTSVACPRFVEFVESGVTSGPEVIEVARDYLGPLVDRERNGLEGAIEDSKPQSASWPSHRQADVDQVASVLTCRSKIQIELTGTRQARRPRLGPESHRSDLMTHDGSYFRLTKMHPESSVTLRVRSGRTCSTSLNRLPTAPTHPKQVPAVVRSRGEKR